MSEKLTRLRTALRRKIDAGETQLQIAKACGVSQSTVSRVVNGRQRRGSGAIDKLCEYADIDPNYALADPRDSEVLMAAVSEAWRGTSRDARLLAAVIRKIGAIRSA